MSHKVLVVDDEPDVLLLCRVNLEFEGYEVREAVDGEEALAALRQRRPDVVLLDVMLPGVNGFELCEQMRASGDATPVLFLSARGDPDDRVRGLQAGGDDYLPKPFHLPEFLLRVNNMLRRRGWDGGARRWLRVGPHRVDLRSWSAELEGGRREPLGERELGILRLLAARAQQVVSRDDILDEVWGEDAFPSTRTIDNYVLRLRRLFEPDPARPVFFHTVWGVGYRFTPEGEESAEP